MFYPRIMCTHAPLMPLPSSSLKTLYRHSKLHTCSPHDMHTAHAWCTHICGLQTGRCTATVNKAPPTFQASSFVAIFKEYPFIFITRTVTLHVIFFFLNLITIEVSCLVYLAEILIKLKYLQITRWSGLRTGKHFTKGVKNNLLPWRH